MARKIETPAIKKMRKDEDFLTRARCEVNPALDNSSLEAYALACKQTLAVQLSLFWLSRLVLSGGGLEALVAVYDGDLLADVEAQAVDEGVFGTSLRHITLGAATPLSRLQQWTRWRARHRQSGKYDLKKVVAGAFSSYASSGAFHIAADLIEGAESEDDVQKAFCKIGVHSPFLSYVMYRDVQIFHRHLPDSVFVGDGASGCLDEIQTGDEDPSTRLQALTERIEAEFPPEETLLVCPRGWTPSLTEHALCELRRWRRRAGRFRSGTKRELGARQAKRQARVKKIWKILGFKKIPARCR